MNVPGTQQIIRIRQPDIPSLVVCEVEIVGPEAVLDPIRDTNQRRTLDVLPDARMQIGPDDRLI
jgi:hypothetical protein